MDRLTEWYDDGQQKGILVKEYPTESSIKTLYQKFGERSDYFDCEEGYLGMEKLKTYEDAEEQGLLLRLPYNIATCGVVYYVDETEREIYRLKADKIEIYKMMISNKFVYTIDCYDFFYEDFGKIVFTTKEEAEQALKQMGE